MKEAKDRVVEIKEVDPKVLRELLRFLYRGEVENSSNMVMRLYELADRYLMQDLKENCLYYMVHHITALNVVDLFCLAKKNDIRTLSAKSKSFFPCKIAIKSDVGFEIKGGLYKYHLICICLFYYRNKQSIIKTPEDLQALVNKLPLEYFFELHYSH